MSIGERRILLILGAALLATRLVFAFAFPIAQISDYSSYFNGALQFAGLETGAQDSWNPVGPKAFYAVPLWLFGPDVRVIGVTNAFLFVFGTAVLWRATREVFDVWTAILTVIIGWLSLSDLYFNNLACTEVLGGFFLNAAFLGLSRPLGARTAAGLGLVLGLGVYNRHPIC